MNPSEIQRLLPLILGANKTATNRSIDTMNIGAPSLHQTQEGVIKKINATAIPNNKNIK
jgi:hypothetical protein